jgi:outer membrane lipoprotein-sorting protein
VEKKGILKNFSAVSSLIKEPNKLKELLIFKIKVMKTQKFFSITGLVIMWIFFSPSAVCQDAREIIRRMDENMRGDAMYSELTMETIRPRYTREISLKSWSLGEDYSLIIVTAPARDQGTAFLKRGNEIWNYVPNIDRTVKMPPSMMSQSWMGSDFTNDDLVRGVSVVDDYTHELLRSENVDGHECYVIEMVPRPDSPIVYDRVLQWVSKEHYLPVKVENYDEFGDLVNTLNFRDIKQLGGRTIPTRIEMIPQDKKGHKTILTTHKADYDVSLDPAFFSQQNMRRLR